MRVTEGQEAAEKAIVMQAAAAMAFDLRCEAECPETGDQPTAAAGANSPSSIEARQYASGQV